MKRLLLLLCIVASLHAADTTIADTVTTGVSVGGVRTPAQGTIQFTPVGQFFSSDGSSIQPVATTATLDQNGTFTVVLAPTTNSLGGATTAAWTARYFLTNAKPRVEIWAVPVSTTPLTIRQVFTTTLPPAAYGQIPLSQISTLGAQNGSCIVLVNGANAYLPCATSGAVYAVFTSQTTWTLPGTTHMQGCSIIPEVYDSSGNELHGAIFRDPYTCTLSVSFGIPEAGMIVFSGQGSGNYGGTSLCALPCTVTQAQHRYSSTALETAFYDALGNKMDVGVFKDPSTYAVTFSGVGSGYPVIGALSGGGGSMMPAYATFSATSVSTNANVAATTLFTPSSAALQVWVIDAAVIESTAGSGCTAGNYTVTVTWTDEFGLNSYQMASFPWASTTTVASGSTLGTRASGHLVIHQLSTTAPTYSITVPTGCSTMQYAYSVSAARLF